MNLRLIHLYTKYIFGRIDKGEFLDMRELISESTDSEFEAIMRETWMSDHSYPSMPDDKKQRIKSNLNFYINSSISKKKRIRNTILSVAAVILILIIPSVLYVKYYSEPVTRQFLVNVETGNRASVKLPDNSNVQLNAKTSLKYDLNDDKFRMVNLQGEAFFQVEKNKDLPFIINVDSIQIEVLGTSFNVQAYDTDDLIKTSLVNGSIKLTGRKLKHEYFLEPMQQLIYSKSNGSVKIVPLDKDKELNWMFDRLVFESEPLRNVIHKIERWYGVTIDLQCSGIEDDLISGSFYKENLQTVLEAIKIQYKVNYTMNENYVTITRKAKK